MEKYSTVNQVLKLKIDEISRLLTQKGLKVGGGLQDRADRLFKYQNTEWEKIPRKEKRKATYNETYYRKKKGETMKRRIEQEKEEKKKKKKRKIEQALEKTDETDLKKDTGFPFETNRDDHCETPAEALQDIKFFIDIYCEYINKTAETVSIYDPFYCTGRIIENLNNLGYMNIYNKNEDFYNVSIPEYDILITNPPYSGQNIKKILKFLKKCGKPFFVLMPRYVYEKPFYQPILIKKNKKKENFMSNEIWYLMPKKRYVFWTNKTLARHKHSHTGPLGERTSPFVSLWYIGGLTKEFKKYFFDRLTDFKKINEKLYVNTNGLKLTYDWQTLPQTENIEREKADNNETVTDTNE
eukprot:GHVL01005258.1.p1 GENE.GHVL01005258.1~~GHVL01005258.1.p1  ORF type:complete len:354 (+),score=100.02 GHVL01005258.1:19-1080(+)